MSGWVGFAGTARYVQIISSDPGGLREAGCGMDAALKYEVDRDVGCSRRDRESMDFTSRLTEKLEELIKKKAREKPPEPQPQMSGPRLFYTEEVIDHFTNPRNVGEMSEEEADGYALIGDPSCGDQMKLWIKVEEGRIADIKFKSYGCPGAIATSSMATHLAHGKSLKEALDLNDDIVVEALGGIPENKKHCSLLGINALHAAVEDFSQKWQAKNASTETSAEIQ